jgi:hypothetical protein
VCSCVNAQSSEHLRTHAPEPAAPAVPCMLASTLGLHSALLLKIEIQYAICLLVREQYPGPFPPATSTRAGAALRAVCVCAVLIVRLCVQMRVRRKLVVRAKLSRAVGNGLLVAHGSQRRTLAQLLHVHYDLTRARNAHAAEPTSSCQI